MINKVKIGQKVISMMALRDDRIETITRLTKTRIVTNKSTYNSSGTLVGASGFDKPSIRSATLEELETCRAAWKRQNIIAQIQREDWTKVSDKALVEVRKILENGE